MHVINLAAIVVRKSMRLGELVRLVELADEHVLVEGACHVVVDVLRARPVKNTLSVEA